MYIYIYIYTYIYIYNTSIYTHPQSKLQLNRCWTTFL